MIKQLARLSVLVATGLLVACAPLSESSRDTEQTVEAVADRSEKILTITEQLLGDADWKVQTSWSTCPEYGEGLVQQFFWAETDAVIDGDKNELAQRVVEGWGSVGLAARAEDVPGSPGNVVVSDPPFLHGTSESGELTRLQIGPAFSSLQVLSACVPGNVLDLNSGAPSP